MSSTDAISLTGLRVHARHGVLEEERAVGQEFVIDVTLRLDLEAAAATDDVRATVHYGVLAEQIATVVQGDPVNLIETVAASVAELVLGYEQVTEVTVTVHKPSAPISVTFGDVAVTMTRGRHSG